jgi:putative transposase
MSLTTTPLLPGNYYHIYNRGINKQRIFMDGENYHYFLQLMKKYLIHSIEVYTYCLMPNHFHILISIPAFYNGRPHLPLSHLLNAYSQSFNKRFKRTGSLFERPYKRKQIVDEKYLWQVICYIHHNPVHHHAAPFEEYTWSSFSSLCSDKPTHLRRDEVFNLFGGREDFILAHESEVELRSIRDYLLET